MSFKADALPVRRKSWLKIASIPRARLGWDFDDCSDLDPDDVELVKRWVRSVRSGMVIRADGQRSCGRGLLIYGQPGNGKTTLALAAVQEMLKEFPLEAFAPSDNGVLVRPAYFITFNGLLDLKGATMGDATDDQRLLYDGLLGEARDDAYNVRVLIIDDVGKEFNAGSGWQKSILHHVLRTRFNNGLPTIVTTNCALETWDGIYGDATESFAREAFAYLVLESNRGDLRK